MNTVIIRQGGKCPTQILKEQNENQLKGGPPESQPKFKAPTPPTKAPWSSSKRNFLPFYHRGKGLCTRWLKSKNFKGRSRIMFPVIIPPENRSPKPFRNTIKEPLPTICNKV